MPFSFIYSFNKYLLSMYYEPGSRNMMENKTDTIPAPIKHRLQSKKSQPFLNIGIICKGDVMEAGIPA